ncbi:GNAT family N-acetyltransferase [Hypericibacter sp.]|uniref:GNAT family N-acetyltransferase n=1 Tax=Hypericibacter sp. TaxID=2705401 RepID=UPI003D6C9701
MSGLWPAAERKLADAKSAAHPLRFQIHDEAGGTMATLRPLLASDLADDRLVATLARWREENKDRFLTIVPFDPEGTRRWMGRFPVGDPGRILFLVESLDGEPLGHYGLLLVGDGEAEIDNTLRGSSYGPRGLFRQVAQQVIRWAIDELGAQRLIVRVMSNNPAAIRHQESNGFIQETVLPLREIREGDIIRREVVASHSESNLPFGLTVLNYPIAFPAGKGLRPH